MRKPNPQQALQTFCSFLVKSQLFHKFPVKYKKIVVSIMGLLERDCSEFARGRCLPLTEYLQAKILMNKSNKILTGSKSLVSGT